MSRPVWEVLIGSITKLDYLASEYAHDDAPSHTLQEMLEQIIQTQLDDDEKEIFYMRFGMDMTIRAIAAALGYTYHAYVQRKLDRIMSKVRTIVIAQASGTTHYEEHYNDEE